MKGEDSEVSKKRCADCGHKFSEHSGETLAGYWRCLAKDCSCEMFMDGLFPIPVKRG